MIYNIINEILEDYILVSGEINTFEVAVVERVWQFLGDLGVPFTYKYYRSEGICSFAWIEKGRVFMHTFKIEEVKK